jgi:hypothetical protein
VDSRNRTRRTTQRRRCCDGQRSGAAFAHATVVSKIKTDGRLASGDRLCGGNVETLQAKEVVGVRDGTPVSETYQAGPASKFSGKIVKVTIDLERAKPLDGAESDELEQNRELEEQSVD